ncbi:MAG: transcription antitermination factor NusB [Verrucomicrobia bacterium]|nr:transcription antitermination factor NusB [Verrucomicrobiota bacterium]
MIKRREIREAAMQLLFAHDLHSELRDEDREAFWQLHSALPKLRVQAEAMVAGIMTNLPEIDETITASVQNYSFDRLNSVDRNILRLSTFELLHKPEVPHAVVINEAIEIASRFATEESARFVNGVLDRIAKIVRKRMAAGTSQPTS